MHAPAVGAPADPVRDREPPALLAHRAVRIETVERAALVARGRGLDHGAGPKASNRIDAPVVEAHAGARLEQAREPEHLARTRRIKSEAGLEGGGEHVARPCDEGEGAQPLGRLERLAGERRPRHPVKPAALDIGPPDARVRSAPEHALAQRVAGLDRLDQARFRHRAHLRARSAAGSTGGSNGTLMRAPPSPG